MSFPEVFLFVSVPASLEEDKLQRRKTNYKALDGAVMGRGADKSMLRDNHHGAPSGCTIVAADPPQFPHLVNRQKSQSVHFIGPFEG